MSLLLLFAGGGSRQPGRLQLENGGVLLLEDGGHLLLEDSARTEPHGELGTVDSLAEQLLAPLDFGLSDEELLRQVVLHWGAEPVASQLEALASFVDHEAVGDAIPHIIEVGNAARAGDKLDTNTDVSVIRMAILMTIMAVATVASVVWAARDVREARGDLSAAVGPMLTLLAVLFQAVDSGRRH